MKSKLFLFYTYVLLSIFPLAAAAEDWWFNPPEDTVEFMYGLGEGFTLQQARQAALADIAGKLSTEISSSLNRLAQENDGRFNESVRQEVSSQTANVELSQFQVIQSYQSNSMLRVLVRLDRQRLAKIWEQRIADLLKRITPIFSLESIRTTKEWREANSTLPYALEARTVSYQLFALTGQAVGPDIYDAVNDLISRHNVAVGVEGDSAELTKAIQDALTQMGLSICSSQCESVISYKAERKKMSAFGEYIAQVHLDLMLIENQNLQNSIRISTRAVSMSNSAIAFQSAARQMNSEVSAKILELF